MADPVGCSPAAVAARYATDGLLVADWERILYLNPALAGLLGVSEAELIGQPIERFAEFVTEPDTVDRLRNAFRQGQPFQGTVTCHPRAGQSIPLELEVTPVPADPTGPSQTPWMVALSARDRTEANRLEQQLWQSQRLDAVTNLADGVAHEINNVVQILTGYGTLVLETLSSDDPRAQDLAAIQQAAHRGGLLLKELLAFAKRRPNAPRVPLDLNEVILGWKDLIQVLVGSDLRLIFDLTDGLPPIKADRSEIQHILLNLVSNARDAMVPG